MGMLGYRIFPKTPTFPENSFSERQTFLKNTISQKTPISEKH